MFIYFERKRERERAGEGQREGERRSQAGSTLARAGLDVGLKLTNCEIIT